MHCIRRERLHSVTPDAAQSLACTPQAGGGGIHLVALAASAGGLHAVGEVLAVFPAGFPAAVLLVQHLDPRYPSRLADILGRRTAIPVKVAEHGEHLHLGRVYVAPPNRHLLVTADGAVNLTESERVRFVRPSANLLFDSVAACYQDRAVAVVLSGTGGDGAMGLRAIQASGGTVVVQDPDSAEFSGMPRAALHSVAADHVLALEAIGPALVRLIVGEAHG